MSPLSSLACRTGWMAAVLGLVLAGGCASDGGGGAAGGGAGKVSPETPVLPLEMASQVGLTQRWVHHVPLAMGEEKIQDFWRVSSAVYVITTDHILHSISVATGTRNWSTDLGPQEFAFFKPALVQDGQYLILMSRTKALLIDRRKGTVTKSFELSFPATTAPVGAGNILAVGSASDNIFGLFIDLLGTPAWKVMNPNDFFISNPVLVEGKNVVVASYSGFVWELAISDGSAVWQNRQVNGKVVGGLATDGVLVFVPSLNNKIYAFTVDELGSHPWDTRLEGTLDQTPVIAGKLLLVPSTGKGLYALATNNGDIKWLAPDVTQVLARTTEHIYATNAQHELLVLSTGTGAVEKKTAVVNVFKYLSNSPGSAIFVITTDGRLAQFEPVE